MEARGLPVIVFAAVGLAVGVSCASLAGIDTSATPGGAIAAGDTGGDDGGGVVQGPTAEGLEMSPASLEIDATCGQAATKTLTLIHNGSEEVRWTLSVPEGSPLQLEDPASKELAAQVSGALAPHTTVLVRVSATGTTPGPVDAQVILETPSSTRAVPTKVTIKGGAISLLPSLIDFGEVRKDTDIPDQDVVIENTGTELVNVTGFAAVEGGSPEFTMGTGSISVPPGETKTATAKFKAGGVTDAISADFTPTTQEPLCVAAPSLKLQGKRVDRSVTFSPGTVDFGGVECKSSGGGRPITFSNYGESLASVSFEVPPDSWFTISPGSSGVVPAAGGGNPGTQTFTIQLNAVGDQLGDHAETIVITTVGDSGEVRTPMSARVNVTGARVDFDPTELTNISGEGKTFKATLRGRDALPFVDFKSSNASFTLSSNLVLGTLYQGLPTTVRVKLGSGGGGQTGTVRLQGGLANLCNDPVVNVSSVP